MRNSQATGHFSVTPAVSYLSVVSEGPEPLGVAAGTGLTALFFVEAHRHRRTSLYYMGAAVAF